MKKKSAKTKEWTMPGWMEKYRKYISAYSGGNPIEELVNDDGTNSNVFNNAPRALICVSVHSIVGFLETLNRLDALTGKLNDQEQPQSKSKQ